MLDIQKKLSKPFLALLALPATAVGFALSTQIAALSWILSKKYGLDIHDVAFVWLAGPIAGIFGQIIVGLISDNVWFMNGRRRPFIMIGGMISTIAFFALPHIRGISHITGITDIVIIASIIALFLDLSINVTFNPARSIIADLTPEGKIRTAGYVWMQIISGSLSVFAYFLSMLFGNETLLYIAAILVFITAVFPILFIEEKKDMPELKASGEKYGVVQIIKEIFPLYGFLTFGLFSLFHHFIPALDPLHNPILIAALIYSVIIGIYCIIKGRKNKTNQNEFHKIMIAHSFTWVAFQSMFILSGFFIENKILPNLNIDNIFANWFAKTLTGVQQTNDSSVGNIVSLGFLILNFIGAVFPIALQSIAKRIGRVKTYIGALIFSMLGYFYIAFLGKVELDFYFGILFVGIGWSAVISIVFAIMSERVNPAKMGLYMGVFNLAVVLPQMMSNGVANIIKQTGNYQLLYILCGVFVSMSILFWIFVHEPEASETKQTVPTGGH
ncbi:Major facilitator superfamily MFS_1 [uncultured Paludibacter sp.]|nr:Major facilitator superfamily MFS_1 [uncultured Paludibacter sp.]